MRSANSGPLSGGRPGEAGEHATVLGDERGGVGGVAVLRRQDEGRPCKGDAADEQGRAVVQRSAGVREAGKRVRTTSSSPGGLGRRGQRGDVGWAAGRGAPQCTPALRC